jgi:hypothetical protein
MVGAWNLAIWLEIVNFARYITPSKINTERYEYS